MRRTVLGFALCGSALLVSSCASIGETAPPSPLIPTRIENLAAVQRGGELLVSFRAPNLSMDGVIIRRFKQMELKAGPAGPDWEKTARLIEIPPEKAVPGVIEASTPVNEWTGRDVMVCVRAAGKHGRFGIWSNVVRLTIVAPIAPPAVEADSAPEGVLLKWAASNVPKAQYRVSRQGPGEPQFSLLATVAAPTYTDNTAQFGKAYSYSVQVFAPSGNSEVQSEFSAGLPITPADKFAPPVPEGVSATASVASIEVSWTPDAAPDMQGYYVYRSAGGAFERQGAMVTAPAYSDRAIKAGQTYRYAISAVDLSGNESARSAPVECAAP